MRPIRTVLVDDALDLRHLIARALESSGRFEIVGEASDGREGVEVVTALQPELVVLDLSMPVMDGLEALPLIRAVAPETQVVILSGHPDSLAAERAFEGGAIAYIEKGISPTALVESLAEAVGAEPEPTVARPPVEPPETLAIVGQLAHDLRTPLASASGFIDLLHRSIDPTTPEFEYATRASAAVARLGRLIEATIAYAREGHVSLELGPTPVAGVLATVRQTIRSTHADEIHRLHVDVGTHEVVADEVALERVLQNLVTNALTYSSGRVSVTARPAGELVRLAVLDEGPGLERDSLEKLFQPFHRGDGGRQHGGTGLGLSLAARLVSQMGGRMRGYNRAGRGGAAFEVELPVAGRSEVDPILSQATV